MGDRQNPIKFGPEWLRNLSRERNAMSNNPNSLSSGSGVNSATGGVGVTNPNSGAGVSSPTGAIGVTNSSPGSGVSSPTGAVGVTSPSASASNPLPGPSRERSSSHNSNKVQLAKLRYGREEMLALYDRNTESPPQLKNIDILYQSRSQPPTALNTTFEEQENMRSSHNSGMMALGERYGMGRAFSGRGFMGRGYLGRGSDGRGRSRGQFIRPPPAGRPSWHSNAPRMPNYNSNIKEELTPFNSPKHTEQTEWHSTKTYKNKRPGGRANWRQLPRDDREEWRSVSTRSRPQDKWDRDWGERPPTSEKSQSWNPNRRTWAGREATNTEDNLPEWAVENAGACGGTFDSSGAFHGYSNDDSNLPRSQENAYSLARSHTHGSFVRQKTAGEGSEEWWASEKAKKLSPKRFDAGGIKFKKPPSVGMSEPGASDTKKSTVNRYESLDEIPVKESSAIVNYDESSQVSSGGNDNNATGAKFVESKTFDSHMRSDIGIEEANDERGNFQSVMITPNNSLRQKHQNIGLPINEGVSKLNRKPGILHLSRASTNSSAESTLKKPNMLTEDKIAEDIFELTLDEKTPMNSVSPLLNPAIPVCLASVPPPPIHQLPKPITMGLQSQTLNLSLNQNNKLPPVRQSTGMHSNMIQQGRMNNSALNASLGLPLDGGNLGIPLQGVPPPVLPNQGIGNSGMGNANMGNTLQGPVGTGAMQSGATGLPGYSASLAWMTTPDVRDNSLFLGQASNNSSQLQGSADFQLTNNTHQNMAWPGHGLQHSASQSSYGSSLYSNMMPQSAAQTPPAHNMTDMWYYEDPKQIIQGPFTSQEMFNWYRGGFFTSSLMVRRACDAVMRPLGSYGPIVPFAPRELMPYQLPGNNLLNNQQSGLGLGVINIPNMTISNSNPVDTIQFGSVDMMRNPINNQNSMVESLWSQPTASSDLMWMQPPPINSHNENRVNNLSMFFWDQQPSAMISNSMLPEGIHKEMKTEDQILEQLRASQNISTSQTLTFMTEPDMKRPESSVAKPNDNFSTSVTATPNMEELQKLIQKETLVSTPPPPIELIEVSEDQVIGKIVNPDSNITEVNTSKPVTVTKTVDSKTSKQTKSEGEKITRKGEKNKNEKVKKSKEEKKEEATEKVKEKEETDSEKRSAEPSPSKSKKEDKVLKKDLEKEKKELVKDGFTIVKGSEKNVNKENKKKAEELKAAEELERKKKEDEEKLAAVEEKKKKQLDTSKKQQEEQQQQQQKQISELIMKKAPWSVVSNQVSPAITKDGLNLAEIQRLEREKKLEQIKEQQHMMQLIAQQQAAALARDQEIQAGLGWAKKKPSNNNTTGQTLTEIQSEARKQAVVTAAALQILEEPQIPVLSPNNHIPWSNTHNGGGFWDTQPSQISKPEPPVDTTKTSETSKIKKKRNLITTTKKEPSPAAEFENWCSVELASWSSKIDVPTFVGFLKDIESPYEVKDYVKCYLGESKDSSDFARQFLERRSKLLRVGMVTPSDDLCSPAIAINPRTISSSDYQEVKSKGKKIKKNKMLKVDSRILGFSVTAAEDRINVGDIDTA